VSEERGKRDGRSGEFEDSSAPDDVVPGSEGRLSDADTSAGESAAEAVVPTGKRSSSRSRSAAAVVWSMSGRDDARQQLTDRETQVLRLLAAGLSNNKIGEKLFISATTAKFHVSNIMRKLDVSRRAEAVYAASKRGLI